MTSSRRPPSTIPRRPPSTIPRRGGWRKRQMVSRWPEARLCPCPHHADTILTGSIRILYPSCGNMWSASAAWRPHPYAGCSIKQLADTHRGDTVSDQRAGKAQNSGPQQQRDTPPLQSDGKFAVLQTGQSREAGNGEPPGRLFDEILRIQWGCISNRKGFEAEESG